LSATDGMGRPPHLVAANDNVNDLVAEIFYWRRHNDLLDTLIKVWLEVLTGQVHTGAFHHNSYTE
jgi:hypothetical protein